MKHIRIDLKTSAGAIKPVREVDLLDSFTLCEPIATITTAIIVSVQACSISPLNSEVLAHRPLNAGRGEYPNQDPLETAKQ